MFHMEHSEALMNLVTSDRGQPVVVGKKQETEVSKQPPFRVNPHQEIALRIG